MLNSARVFALFALLSFASSAQVIVGSQGPPLTPPASTTPPDQKCVIQGHVNNSQTGEPLKKATIRLTRRMSAPASPNAPMAGPQGYSASSEADGSFHIGGIEPGDYNLSGNRTGYLNTQYGAKSPLQAGTVLNLTPGQQMSNLNLALMPQAVITGKTLDEDGDLLSGTVLEVLAQTWFRGKQRLMARSGSNSNDVGEFRVAGLSPGKYYLCAERRPEMNELSPPPGKPDIRPIRTCYPDALTTDAATPIVVQAGQDVSGIEIHVKSAATYHVRGKIAGNLPAGQAQRVNVSISPRNEQGAFFGSLNQAAASKDNSFDIAGVAPGAYSVNAFEMAGAIRGLAQQPIDVGNADVNDVVLSILPPGSIHGAIVLDGTPQAGLSPVNLANVHVNLTQADVGRTFGPQPNSQSKSDGTFTLDNVFPGKYYVQANAPAGTYLKSVRFGSQDMLGKELDLSQSASGDLEIVFRYGVVEVDGTVQAAQNAASEGQPAPPSSASIVLVPDTLNADGSGMRFGNANQSSSFTMKNVPPGHYRAYAFEDVDMNELQNPDLLKQLESKGTDVEVKENDRKQIQLPLISSDELHQIFARLGIDSSR